MIAQVLYDTRENTAQISGSDLHILFYAICGEPSPAGRTEIDVNMLAVYMYRTPDTDTAQFIASILEGVSMLQYSIGETTASKAWNAAYRERKEILATCDEKTKERLLAECADAAHAIWVHAFGGKKADHAEHFLLG